MKKLFFIEVTDTFAGEANYSWVTRHVIKAKSVVGAVNKFSRLSGMRWRMEYDSLDEMRYNSLSGATCYFLQQYDDTQHADYNFSTDER
jgi:hypothetical protein